MADEIDVTQEREATRLEAVLKARQAARAQQVALAVGCTDCDECGGEIPPARLGGSRLCAECAGYLEQREQRMTGRRA